MKVIFDTDTCIQKNLTLQEALITKAFSMGKVLEVIHNMQNRNIINKDGISISPQWKEIVDTITKTEESDHLLELAIQMRECYPEGKMPGTAFYYRCNKKEICTKLKKFLLTYGEYSNEDIIKATKRFVASFKGDYRYLPLMKYFISKNKKVMGEDGLFHVVEVSELASTLENMTDDDTIEIEDSEDWLVNSRN